MRLAVFDADSPPALAFIRSAGQLGVAVDVYSDQHHPPARYSRYVRRFSTAPSVDDLATFLPWLKKHVERGEITCIAPTSDQIAFAITEVQALLPETVQRALPTVAAAHSMLMKDRMPVVEGSRLRTPVSFYPTSIGDAVAHADSYPYPLVMKPRAHIALPFARGRVLEDAKSLRTHIGSMAPDDSTRDIVARFPGVEIPMLQSLLVVERLVSVSGLLVDGRVCAMSASVKSLTWPPPLGVGLIFTPAPDEPFMQDAARYVEATLGEGLFELEICIDPRDTVPRVLDVNPRAFGQISLDMARGLDLPGLWIRRARGEAIEDARPTRNVSGWQHSLPLAIARAVDLAAGRNRSATLHAVIEDLRQHRVDVVFDKRDPLPGAVFIGSMLQHPGGLVKPFVREAIKNRMRGR
jgi:predicted ATP-grasp superfamily ATP-dependent carboligase